jgi:hypothetical protein
MSANEACIFCGSRWGKAAKHSEQHVLGQRLRKHAGDLPNSRTTGRESLIFDPETQQFIAHPMPALATRDASLLNLRTRQVCEDCNTGWMKALEEEATPIFLAVADAAEGDIRLPISRAQALLFTRFAQNMALAHELTTRPPHVGNVSMGNRLRLGKAVRGSTVWIARNHADLDIQFRQVHVSISDTPIVRPGDPERFSMLLALSWHYLTLLTYIPDSPRLGPSLAVGRWQLVWPCSADGLEFPSASALSLSELNSALTEHQLWLPPVLNQGVRTA